MNNKKVLLAMSGGVDSSTAAALLLKDGYDVIGITMIFISNDESSKETKNPYDDAKKICLQLGIPHHTIDLQSTFKECVINNFINSYENALTPNPCVICNKFLKLRTLLQKKDEYNCSFIATGHYAKIKYEDNEYKLTKAKNKKKDQSYFLYTLNQEILSTLLFPLSDFSTKDEIRNIAQEYNLPIANKTDSQDVCFISENNIKTFLIQKKPSLKQKGNIIFANTNKIIGTHDGHAFYTIGQRKGLGISWNTPLYITKINPLTNELTVNTYENLFNNTLFAENITFTGKSLKANESIKIKAKIRYAHKEASALLTMIDDTKGKVVFDDAQKAITPGQSVVFYDKDYVVGGGIISP